MRSYVEVPQSSVGLFGLLTSAEGAKILDDTTNHTDAPLEVLRWEDRRALPRSNSYPCIYYGMPGPCTFRCPVCKGSQLRHAVEEA